MGDFTHCCSNFKLVIGYHAPSSTCLALALCTYVIFVFLLRFCRITFSDTHLMFGEAGHTMKAELVQCQFCYRFP